MTEIEAGGKKHYLNEQEIKEVITHIFDKPNECKFDVAHPSNVCAPPKMVNKMKEYIEKKHKKSVPANPDAIISNMKDLLDCNSESCIFKNADFKEFAGINQLNSILDQIFKPEGPANDFGLLSNFNIDDVLDQFESKFANRKFLHIPFQMRDFETVGTQLATIDLAEQFKKGIKTFGVVLNTDKSSGNGIHWFCLFGEHYGDKIILEYFNSSGKPPLPEIQIWLQKTKHHLNKSLKIPVDIHYSTGIYFQHDDHSCGVYCLCYIWCRLERIPPTWFKSENFNDKLMHKARKNLFRWEN